MRAQAFENIAVLLANCTDEEEKRNLKVKLSILKDRNSTQAASVIREMTNLTVELE